MRVEITEIEKTGKRTYQSRSLPLPVSARLRVHHPDAETAVVTAVGELDDTQEPRLRELLRSRLASMVRSVVVEVTGVEFLSVGALQTLLNAACRAEARGVEFQLVGQPPCVQRALAAAALTRSRPQTPAPETPLPRSAAAAENLATPPRGSYTRVELDNYRLLPLGAHAYQVEVSGEILGYLHPADDRIGWSAHTVADVAVPHPRGAANTARAVTDLFRSLNLGEPAH